MSQHLREGWAKTSASSRRMYHGSGATIGTGDALRADGGNYQPSAYSDQGSIYVTDALDLAYFYAVFGSFSAARFDDTPHVYEVEAQDPKPAKPGEWTTPAATVMRDVTEQARAAFSRNWERVWLPMIEGMTVGGMPTKDMIIMEFESRMGRYRTATLAEVTFDESKAQSRGVIRARCPECASEFIPCAVLRWKASGEIQSIGVTERHRRQGLATELLRRARTYNPNVHHSEDISDEGREWAKAVGSKTAAPTSWRPVVDTNHVAASDAVILTQYTGTRRFFEVYTYGVAFGNYPTLEGAKAAIEEIYHHVSWERVSIPKVEVYHYFYGPTDEFSDPTVMYVADLPRLGAVKHQ